MEIYYFRALFSYFLSFIIWIISRIYYIWNWLNTSRKIEIEWHNYETIMILISCIFAVVGIIYINRLIWFLFKKDGYINKKEEYIEALKYENAKLRLKNEELERKNILLNK